MMSTAAEGGGTVRNNGGGGGGGRYPFTATQWQELEHQALVYKYMISGMPIPPDLLFTIKRSLDSSTKLILHHQPPHPSIGWNCFQMGFGRKIDPEPGRCRRTDGKKWRCSKEAYPDSKYCERHMHRGRNRSRKPVEVNMSTTPKTPPTAIPMIPSSICTKSPNYPSPNSHPFSSTDHFYNTPHLSSFSRPSSGSGGIQDHFLLESSPYSHSDKDYRKSFGMKEEIDEHRFFSESSGTIKTLSGSSMADSWQLEPLAMNNLTHSKQTSFSDQYHHHQNGYSYQQQQQQQQDQSYYDQFSLKFERKDEPQKVMHHFFDEWPPNDNNKDSSTTRLSISIPNSAHNFFLTHNDK
ncbi:growth-regulating factor 1-like [Cynara cardunculus var. scolymus]|uniref:growth-regulating factor 1-like n=1 Tax=Cynara cardunculus var. scolymus TaxID=59895 RepID=UPI000D629ED0|nr:growth-regulating factor 1-like [Cynara cardunculus var. scolymus]